MKSINLFYTWMIVMAPYGAYRQWNTGIDPPNNLLGHRSILAICNSIMYVSPFGITKVFSLINRADIYYNKRDKTMYKSSYEELLGINYNTI
jgi:hypothetical protein